MGMLSDLLLSLSSFSCLFALPFQLCWIGIFVAMRRVIYNVFSRYNSGRSDGLPTLLMASASCEWWVIRLV